MQPPKTPRSGPSTPSDFPIQPPAQQLPGGDYSYTVEVVGTINHALGKLTEAVDTLKDQVKEHGSELKTISRDIHTAKTPLKIVGALLAALLAFAGWAINKGVDAYVASHQQQQVSSPGQK